LGTRINSLLYFSPSWAGGLADYAHEQANALVDVGLQVEILTVPAFRTCRGEKYTVIPALSTPAKNPIIGRRVIDKLASASRIMQNAETLAKCIVKHNHQHILFGSYFEYLAPLWARQLRKLTNAGKIFGAIIHDPVRDYAVGPFWWHRLSVASGYSFLREVFVHEDIELDTVRPMPQLRTTVIPHGSYQFPQPTLSRGEARKKLNLPEFAHVVLSFGHIRDGKNLDLAIKAMASLPSVYLVIAGKEQSGGQKPISYYQELACSLKVNERCRWIHGYIPEEEIGNLFLASDLTLLTYSRNFRSASGVMNAAVCYRKPCLASSGGSNLRTVIEKYNLGWFIEPDDLTALRHGVEMSIHNQVNPQWHAYETENSWQRNALIVKDRMFNS